MLKPHDCDAGERREAARISVNRRARMKPNEWSVVEMEVIDISSDGFRGRCSALLRADTYVALQVPGIGYVDARLVWFRNGEFSARFLQAIDLQHCSWASGEQEASLAGAIAKYLPEPDGASSGA